LFSFVEYRKQSLDLMQ